MKRILAAPVLFLCMTLMAAVATTGSIQIAWDPNSETDLAGYKVYWGAASRAYSNTPVPTVAVSTAPAYTITGLVPGTYYIAVTAYNTSSLESSYSNEVTATIFPTSPGGPVSLRSILTTSSSSTTATVAWVTSVPTDGAIDYDVVNPPTASHVVVDTTFVTNHVAKLVGLRSATTYYFKVVSKTADGGVVTSQVGSFATK